MIHLQYGTEGLPLDVSGLDVHVMRPTYPPALADEHAGFIEAMRSPIDHAPIAEWITADHRVAIAIPDITRALPTRQLLTWLFEDLSHVPAERFVIVAGTGSHRGHTTEEWHRIVGAEIYERYECVDHGATDDATLVPVGRSRFGYDVRMNRRFVEADRHILLGFIEPHFMAGFSGGYKASFPGVASLDAIMHYHNAANIGHPKSTWGVLDDNPTQHHVRAAGSLVPDCFLLNVTLDEDRRITGYFCGDPIAAHGVGCAFCKKTAMQACDEPFSIVVTTNSGYPLDQNLYQAVKGMCAAAEVVADRGLIIAAARCNDGFPAHGHFRKFLLEHASFEAMLAEIHSPGFRMMDQWQVQKLADVLTHARVQLFSDLDDEAVRSAHLHPIADVRAAIDAELTRLGRRVPIAILPEGPLTIPYLRQPVSA